METKKESLINKQLIDLREMLERENKLLANKKFIEKLKDKGEKVRRFRDEIEKTIKIKESVEEAESFLAKLSIGDKQVIMPKHPMFSVSSDDMKSAKQAMNNQKSKNDVLKQILNEDIDIFSIAISRTFDEELCQKRSERFMPNRIPKKVADSLDKKNRQLNRDQTSVGQQVKIDQHSTDEEMKIEKQFNRADNHMPNVQNRSQIKSPNNRLLVNRSTNNLNLFDRYKDTALEPFNKESKFVALSIDSSLECGKDQKVKDYEVEKIKLEKRLEWRKITEFDSDESEDSEYEDEIE